METSVSLLGRLAGAPTDADWRRLDDLYRPLLSAWVARAGVPTVMMFVQSLHGISHNKIEDTKEEHLEMCVTAFDKLAEKAMGWVKAKT